MAEPGLIEALMRECATLLPRKLQPEEVDAALRVWVRHLEPYDGQLLGDAVDSWIMNQTDDRPPFKLPSAKLMMRICSDLASTSRLSPDEETFRNFVPARPEFVRAHMEAQRKIKTINQGLLKEHDHKVKKAPMLDEAGEPVTDEHGAVVHHLVGGAEVCPVCGPEGDSRREMVDEILEALPEPQSGGAKSCKCDGSGWIEVKDPLSRDVYPCSTCNAYFWEWRGLDASEAS